MYLIYPGVISCSSSSTHSIVYIYESAKQTFQFFIMLLDRISVEGGQQDHVHGQRGPDGEVMGHRVRRLYANLSGPRTHRQLDQVPRGAR